MKARERLKRLRQSSDLRERWRLAADDMPGTEFDDLFHDLKMAMDMTGDTVPEARMPGLEMVFNVELFQDRAKAVLLAFGYKVALAIRYNDASLLRRMAVAVDQWHQHMRGRHGRTDT